MSRSQTKVLEKTEPRFTNRLSGETSPYLLQHAHNPVNWYPWGKEALERAKEQDKPMFVSIGYSACHWCHVMERESFEDEGTARILNEHFIPIKVDREERPDLDAVYMNAVVAITGSGGWPLNVFLTPDLKPFYGGTYFPPSEGYSIPSFKRVLTGVADAWNKRRDQVVSEAARLVEAIDQQPSGGNTVDLIDKNLPAKAVALLMRMHDQERGGFGGAPKFPQCGSLAFLLRQYAEAGDEKLLAAVENSLQSMAYGGIYDQLGGGFHRYSVDADWLVPHFEKMLYDNAMLAELYLEAYQVTRSDIYSRIARETLDYVLRDMSDKDGGFHAAEDADSEGVEGKFYIWSKEEIQSTLSGCSAADFIRYYGVTGHGNFEGMNILNVESKGEPPPGLAASRRKLLEVRSGRTRPGRDYKVIAAWNGMMITALIRGYEVLGDDRYLKAANRAGNFICDSMTEKGVLARSYARGRKGAEGYLDDYANMANAYLDLFEATGELAWLSAAEELTVAMIKRFGDGGHGFFFASDKDTSLIIRQKEFSDNATRSGNAVAAKVLIRIARLTGGQHYYEAAEGLAKAARRMISSSPMGYIDMLTVAGLMRGDSVEVVIVGDGFSRETLSLASPAWAAFLPYASVVLVDGSSPDYPELQKRLPLLEGRGLVDGKPAAYVCFNRTCRLPVSDPVLLARELEGVGS